VALGVIAVVVYLRVSETLRNCYALWWVADMVILHIQWEGKWPKGWDDLAEPYDVYTSGMGSVEGFDDLRARVDVDFSADPKLLARAEPPGEGPPFRVITLRNGRRHHWSGREPNRMVWEFLRGMTRPHPTSRPLAAEKEARAALSAAGASWRLDDAGRVTGIGLASRPKLSGGIPNLTTLTAVEELNLGDSGITDADLGLFAELVTVRTIYLYRTRVTDGGLAHLRRMRDLETLALAGRNFSDAAFDHITKFPRLRLLNLNGARVSDAGIARLHPMTTLRRVLLGETLVTEDGVRRLQRALPDCEIYSTVGRAGGVR
jgi:hypothetical protein